LKAGVSEQINRRAGRSVRLQPPGQRPEQRFPLIVEALARLRSRSCIIDGEAVACDDNGIASFDQIRHRHGNRSIEPQIRDATRAKELVRPGSSRFADQRDWC